MGSDSLESTLRAYGINRMIRWYDYPAAFLMADVLATSFFTIPVFGAIIAYVLYEFGWNWYCNFRLEQENR
jgi:hypothetical protein